MPQQPGSDWQDYSPSKADTNPVVTGSNDGGWQDYEHAKANVTAKQASTPTTREQIQLVMGGKKWEELPVKTKMQVLTLGFGQKAQDYANKAFGPESQGKGVLDHAWNELKSLLAEAGETVMKPITGLTDPKTAAVAASGVAAPEIPATVFGVEALRNVFPQAAEAKHHPTPGNVQDLLLTGSQLLMSPAALKSEPIETASAYPKPEGKAAGVTRGILGFGPDVTKEAAEKAGTKHLEEKAAATTKQQEETAKAEAANRSAIDKHATERRDVILGNEQAQAAHLAEVDQVTQENAAAQARSMDEYRAEVRRVQEVNQAAQDQVSERGRLARQVEQQSQQLGEGVQQAAREANAEGNRRYRLVQDAVGDQKRSLETLTGAVTNAKDNILRTPENIKIFSDIMREAEHEEAVTISGQEVSQGQVAPDIWEQLVAGGFVQNTPEVPFSFFQGVYTKTGKMLSKGTLPGDVYKAVESVNNAAGREMQAMARDAGAEHQLSDAQAYWREYRQTFYDKDSAVAQVLKRVGKLDPGYYSDPFISGKAAQRGISKLQRYSPELARLAESVKQTHGEMSALPKTAKVTAEPALPKTSGKALPEPPAPKELPGKPEMKTAKKIEQPEKPTIDVRDTKNKESIRLMKTLRGLSRYDLNRLTAMGFGTVIAMLSGGAGSALTLEGAAATVPAYFAGRYALKLLLEKPAVTEWLTRPQPGDVQIIRQLPPEVRNAVRVEFGEVAAQLASHNPKVKFPREVQQFLNEKPEHDDQKKKKSGRAELLEQGEELTQPK